jgi:deoxycytidylate deaminase
MGTCNRRTVQCWIEDEHGNVLSEASNGPVGDSCECPGAHVPAGHGDASTRCYAIHAEIRALLRLGDRVRDAHTIYSTKEPCLACALALAGSPIKHVYYVMPSNKRDGALEFWQDVVGGLWERYK